MPTIITDNIAYRDKAKGRVFLLLFNTFHQFSCPIAIDHYETAEMWISFYLSTSEEPRRIRLIMILWDVGFAGYFVTFCLFVEEIAW